MSVNPFEIAMPDRGRHSEARDRSAIEEHLELVGFMQSLDLLVPVPGQPDLDLVLALAREGVGKKDATARAGRKTLDVLLLGQVRADPERAGLPTARRLIFWAAEMYRSRSVGERSPSVTLSKP